MKSKVVLSLRISLGAVFLISSILKIISINEFIEKFQEYSIFNETIIECIAIIICVSELLIGLFLVLNILPKLILNYAILLLSIFTVFVLYAVLFNKNWYCNCFGSILSAKINNIKVLINIILLIIAIYCRYNIINLFTFENMTKQKQRMIIGIICSLSIIGSSYLNVFRTNKELFEVGHKINLKQIKGINGLKLENNARKQPYLLLILFSLRDCKYCLTEAYMWQKINKKYNDKVMVVGVVRNARKSELKTFILNKKIGFKIYNDMVTSIFKNNKMQTPFKVLLNRKDVIIKIDGPRVSIREQNEFINYIDKLK